MHTHHPRPVGAIVANLLGRNLTGLNIAHHARVTKCQIWTTINHKVTRAMLASKMHGQSQYIQKYQVDISQYQCSRDRQS